MSTVIGCAALEQVVSEAAELCASDGLTPTVAARLCIDGCRLSSEDLQALAVVGLARIVQDRVGRPSGARQPRRIHADRSALRERMRDALGALFLGADGRMRSLSEFSAEDHRHRLADCDAKSSGWRRSARFHHEAIAELKRHEASTIADLPVGVQDRLRRIL